MKFIFKSIKTVVLLTVMMLFVIPQSVVAQQEKPQNLRLYDTQPYHFGFIIGYNQMSYAMNFYDSYQLKAHDALEYPSIASSYYNPDARYYARSITPIPEHGFVVGVVGNLRLAKYFDLRLIPSLSFGTRTIEYQFYKELPEGVVNDNPYYETKKSIFSTFVELPLQVKYRSKRYNNVAGYIIAGGNFKIDLASQKKSQIEVTNPETGELITVTDNIRVKRTDLAAEIGAGFDFYTSHFKFGVEAKMSFGLLNILDSQNIIYDSSVKNIHNRTFQVSLTFE